jgi:hypothetical protein
LSQGKNCSSFAKKQKIALIVNRSLTFKERQQKLKTYFSQPIDLRFFVGVPLAEPTHWHEVFSLEGAQLYSSDLKVYDLQEVKSWIACYVTTFEIVDGENIFGPLPESITGLNKTDAQMPPFRANDLRAGLKSVAIEFAPSPTHLNDKNYYQTTLINNMNEPIRCLSFGAFRKSWFRFHLSTATGSLYSAAQFQDWYGVRRGGWIEPNERVSDPTNYGSSCYWVYFLQTSNSKLFHTGKHTPQ